MHGEAKVPVRHFHELILSPRGYCWIQGGDPYFNKLIRILATRCMTQVLYEASSNLCCFSIINLVLRVLCAGNYCTIVFTMFRATLWKLFLFHRPCTSAAEIVHLRSFTITDLRRPYIRTSLLLSEDMLVGFSSYSIICVILLWHFLS